MRSSLRRPSKAVVMSLAALMTLSCASERSLALSAAREAAEATLRDGETIRAAKATVKAVPHTPYTDRIIIRTAEEARAAADSATILLDLSAEKRRMSNPIIHTRKGQELMREADRDMMRAGKLITENHERMRAIRKRASEIDTAASTVFEVTCRYTVAGSKGERTERTLMCLVEKETGMLIHTRYNPDKGKNFPRELITHALSSKEP